MTKKKLKLYHFDNYALTITLLPRKLVPQISWFPKYILYSYQKFHKGKFQ